MPTQAGKGISEKVKTHLDLRDCSANVGFVVRNRVVLVKESESKTGDETMKKGMSLIDIINRAQNEGKTVAIENDILKDAVAEVIADKRKSAVQCCKGLITEFETALKCSVGELKSIRAQEKAQTIKVRALDRATRYFAATANPLPMFKAMAGEGNTRIPSNARYFCDNINVPVPPMDDPAWIVPDDWSPEVDG